MAVLEQIKTITPALAARQDKGHDAWRKKNMTRLNSPVAPFEWGVWAGSSGTKDCAHDLYVLVVSECVSP
eukprot:4673975-Pyramimonas_sp.AAC.1